MSKVLLCFRYMQHEHSAITADDSLDVVKVANTVTRTSLHNLQVVDNEFVLDKFLGVANIEIYGSDVDALVSIKSVIDQVYKYYSMISPDREKLEEQEEEEDLDTTTIEDFDNGFDFFTFVYEKVKDYYVNSNEVTNQHKPLWSENVNFAKLLLITV
jgi:hypothetical protein